MAKDTVYLLHFDQPLGDRSNPHGQAQHYIGWTPRLSRRLWVHRQGRGARIVAAVVARGLGFRLARTWPGGPDLERRIKNRKEAPRLCPICKANRQLIARLDQLEP
jgi:hypothetical protein